MHHVDSFSYGGWGLYTDEGSSHIVLRNNLVHHTKDGGFDQHYGRANLVENNVFAFGRECLVRRNDRKDQHSSFTFQRNMVLGDHPKMLCGGWKGGPESRYSLGDNVYWVTGGAAPDFAGKAMAAWRTATGQDARSLVADPRFEDAGSGDFRLRPGSPALRVGFRPWDFRRAGPRTDATLTRALPDVPGVPR